VDTADSRLLILTFLSLLVAVEAWSVRCGDSKYFEIHPGLGRGMARKGNGS
jgi:hypothetical protein